MRQLGVVLAAIIVLATGSATAGVTVSETIAGQDVTVYAAEESYAESEYHDDTVDLTFNRTTYGNGADVNGEGAEVNVIRQSRAVHVHMPGTDVSNERESVFVDADASAQGVNTDNRVAVELVEVSYDIGNEAGHVRHGIVKVSSQSWGDEFTLGRSVDATGSAGTLENYYAYGDVEFAHLGVASTGNERVGDIRTGSTARSNNDAYAGDWSGTESTVSGSAARCAGTDCDWDYVSESACLVGYRQPFFFDCLLS